MAQWCCHFCSDCSNCCRWWFMSPRLANPINAPVCLSYTRSSRMCISSNIRTTCLCQSSHSTTSGPLITWLSTSCEKPVQAFTYSLSGFVVRVGQCNLTISGSRMHHLAGVAGKGPIWSWVGANAVLWSQPMMQLYAADPKICIGKIQGDMWLQHCTSPMLECICLSMECPILSIVTCG